jgi:hypothetical protein
MLRQYLPRVMREPGTEFALEVSSAVALTIALAYHYLA